MYFPILTAKQNELLALNELPEEIFSITVPILILPKSKNLKSQLLKIIDKNIYFILVINSPNRSHPNQHEIQKEFIDEFLNDYENFSLAYIVDKETSPYDIIDFFDSNPNKEKSLIHYSEFPDYKFLLKNSQSKFDIYLRDKVSDDYVNSTASGEIVYIKDGFKRKNTNREYPEKSEFSSFIFTYESEGIYGFGDYNVIGKDVKDGGGSPYAIVLHLTTIDKENITVYHFLSDDNDDQKNQANKFRQAVKKLIEHLDSNPMFEGEGIKDFRRNHNNEHFPNLGVCKRMSIKNHIEQITNAISII